MGCHAGPGGDPFGDNGVLGFRDPVTGTEQIGHIVAIVQDSQADLASAWNPSQGQHNTTQSGQNMSIFKPEKWQRGCM